MPWFGSDLAVCEAVGVQMGNPAWACVLFAGGCSVLPFLKCRAGVANDLHRHIINLARVLRNPNLKEVLIRRLDESLFHPEELIVAQQYCLRIEEDDGMFTQTPKTSLSAMDWAYNYFITGWMGRSAASGTDGEFKGKLSTRYNAGGGGSNTRFRSTIESLEAWHNEVKRWEWECLDCFEMLGKIKDPEQKKDQPPPVYGKDKAIYVDAPWPEQGDGYRHKFTERHQRQLADKLSAYKYVRIVARYGDHPLIRDLYSDPHWTIIESTSRDQANQSVPELLIVNGGVF